MEPLEPRLCLSAITFNSAANSNLSARGQFVVAQDLDADGHRDLIVSSYGGQRLQLLFGTGNGTFGNLTDISLGNRPDFVLASDLNKDGKVDLVAVSYDDSVVTVLMGNGDGTFEPEATYGGGTGPRAAVVGDFNGDSKLDLLLAKSFDTKLTLLRGNGDGTFQSPQTISLSFAPTDLVAGDFNGDGKLDVAASCYFDDKVRILTNNGSGAFSVSGSADVGSGPSSIAAADFDGDGKLDLATANFLSNNVSIVLGSGDGTLQAATNRAAAGGATHVAATDFDGDNKIDLVTANTNADSVSILQGNGDGSFQSAVNRSVLDQPRSTAVADVDGDGMPDVVAVHQGVAKYSVLISTTTPADVTRPTVTLVSTPDVTQASNGNYRFVVRFDDNFALDPSTIGNADMQVNGPDGYARTATLVSTSTNGTSITATYEVAPPAGGWAASVNGTYTISMRSNQVFDVAGNAVNGGARGTFDVNVYADLVPPTVTLVSAPNITLTSSGNYRFVVRYDDNFALDPSTIGNADVQVNGPGGYARTATLVSTSGSGTSITATYEVEPPTGGWVSSTSGTYTISMRSNQVFDAAGNAVNGGARGTFAVNIDYAGNATTSAKSLGAVGVGIVRVASDIVSASDRNDYYKITIGSLTSLDVKLTNLTDNADVQLLDSVGNRLAQSKRTGTGDERIIRNVKKGTYYIRVLYQGSGSTGYRLRVAGAAPVASPVIDDSLAAARNVGSIFADRVRVFDDALGPNDSQDFYRFTLADTETLSLKVQNLAADAHLELFNSSGQLIGASRHAGSADETLSRTLAAGNYYARVYLASNALSTAYRLRAAIG